MLRRIGTTGGAFSRVVSSGNISRVHDTLGGIQEGVDALEDPVDLAVAAPPVPLTLNNTPVVAVGPEVESGGGVM